MGRHSYFLSMEEIVLEFRFSPFYNLQHFNGRVWRAVALILIAALRRLTGVPDYFQQGLSGTIFRRTQPTKGGNRPP